MKQNTRALGILQLQCAPSIPLSERGAFPFPVICRQVPGAWVQNVVFGGDDGKMEAAYISVAKELVAEGAVAITSNCGFTIKYQHAMTQALSVPVSMSSLLFLPYLLTTIKGRVGILTFDSRPLTPDVLRLAGIKSCERIAIGGIENSETWKAMSRPENDYTIPQLANDVLSTATRLAEQYKDLDALLFECAGFPLVAQEVRKRTGLPVYDAVTNANLLMSGCDAGNAKPATVPPTD
ncbi:hypothetical protein [Bradyrhizobium sp. CCBAU 21362]|uniref:hypothetical protein n=1 Tax=Bradyrhizobium sp. CCBAU 21362 TaxID=1325082 RepID=UPI00230610B6|nr:hypothetical protein [Bradyrhizobium sp. CCBAU 21362]